MSRKTEEPTVWRHIGIFASDWEFLSEHFGRQSDTRLGINVAIRQMVRKGVRDYQERLARRVERVARAPDYIPPLVTQTLDRFFVEAQMDAAGASEAAEGGSSDAE